MPKIEYGIGTEPNVVLCSVRRQVETPVMSSLVAKLP